VQSSPTATTGGIQCTATASAILSGIFTPGVHSIAAGNGSIMGVTSGNSLCIIATPGAGLNIQGMAWYVQQP